LTTETLKDVLIVEISFVSFVLFASLIPLSVASAYTHRPMQDTSRESGEKYVIHVGCGKGVWTADHADERGWR